MTVQFVCFAWIFFRAASLDSALVVLERIGSLTFSMSVVKIIRSTFSGENRAVASATMSGSLELPRRTQLQLPLPVKASHG